MDAFLFEKLIWEEILTIMTIKLGWYYINK